MMQVCYERYDSRFTWIFLTRWSMKHGPTDCWSQKRLGQLLSEELRRSRSRKQFGDMLDQVRRQPGEPMSMEEIQAEVNAVREQRRRESGH